MYGKYSYPVHLEKSGVIIDVNEENGVFRYRRDCGGDIYEALLSDPEGRLLINPVEPVNLPRTVTRFLEIEFERILVSPESGYLYYLTFPVEIGVFIESGEDSEVLDIFSLADAKYSLYGAPTDGEIVRSYISKISRELPETDYMREGIMSLSIINSEKEIHSVSKSVYDSYAMKIYYNDEIVSMVCRMRLYPNKVAETEFLDVPLVVGMEKSAELYTARKIPVMKRVYTMERGYD